MKTYFFLIFFFIFGFMFLSFSSTLFIPDSLINSFDSLKLKKIPSFFIELANSSEIIVEGHIIEIENLYKKGGVFHQLITLKTDSIYKYKFDSTYKNNSIDSIFILLRSGYTEIAHRKFVFNGIDFEKFKKCDTALFFLSRKGVFEQKDVGNEDYKSFLNNKICCTDDDENRNILFIKKNKFDTLYLYKFFPDAKTLSLVEFREALRLIVSCKKIFK